MISRFCKLTAPISMALVFCASCSSNCPTAEDEEPGAPIIVSLELLEQLEGDPWTLVMGIDFEDSDGNLGESVMNDSTVVGGYVEFYINGGDAGGPLAVADAFTQRAYPLTQTSGKIAIPLRFSDSISNGAEIVLSAQLVDGDGLRSNCYSVELSFALNAVTASAAGRCAPLYLASR